MGAPLLPILLVTLIAAWLWSWRKRGSPRPELYVGLAILGGFCILLGASLVKVFRSAESARDRSLCMQNLRNLGKAMLAYSADYDNRLPHANWCDCIGRYISPGDLQCPKVDSPFGYVMSEAAVGVSRDDFFSPARVLVAFDGPGGKNLVGGIGMVRYPHLGAGQVLFADGHAKSTAPAYHRVAIEDGQMTLEDLSSKP